MTQKPVKLNLEDGGLDDVIKAMSVKGLGESLEEGLETATEFAQMLVSSEESSGVALASFLHGINFHWSKFEVEEGDSFADWAVRSTGRNKATVQRRICAWEFLNGDYIPKDFRKDIEKFSVRMLTTAYRISVRQVKNKRVGNYDFLPMDYDISEKQWRSLAESADEVMVREVVDEITGRDPKDSRVSFSVDDKGLVWYYRGKKEGAVVAQLFIENKTPLVVEGVNELMERFKIKERDL